MSRHSRKRHSAAYDSHHILHYRRNWSKGFKLQLRRAFVYELPVGVHQDLHKAVAGVPPLCEWEARNLWMKFRAISYKMDLFEALEWLQGNAPNEEFAEAIRQQYEFLRDRLEAV